MPKTTRASCLEWQSKVLRRYQRRTAVTNAMIAASYGAIAAALEITHREAAPAPLVFQLVEALLAIGAFATELVARPKLDHLPRAKNSWWFFRCEATRRPNFILVVSRLLNSAAVLLLLAATRR